MLSLHRRQQREYFCLWQPKRHVERRRLCQGFEPGLTPESGRCPASGSTPAQVIISFHEKAKTKYLKAYFGIIYTPIF